VAERREASVLAHAAEPPEPAPGHVLEEDALDRVAGAELEHLLEGGIDEARHPRIVADRVPPCLFI
jgi:hypothetical protein